MSNDNIISFNGRKKQTFRFSLLAHVKQSSLSFSIEFPASFSIFDDVTAHELHQFICSQITTMPIFVKAENASLETSFVDESLDGEQLFIDLKYDPQAGFSLELEGSDALLHGNSKRHVVLAMYDTVVSAKRSERHQTLVVND